MTPNPMNAAIPERRPATEEISVLIEPVTFHNDEHQRGDSGEHPAENMSYCQQCNPWQNRPHQKLQLFLLVLS